MSQTQTYTFQYATGSRVRILCGAGTAQGVVVDHQCTWYEDGTRRAVVRVVYGKHHAWWFAETDLALLEEASL